MVLKSRADPEPCRVDPRKMAGAKFASAWDARDRATLEGGHGLGQGRGLFWGARRVSIQPIGRHAFGERLRSGR